MESFDTKEQAVEWMRRSLADDDNPDNERFAFLDEYGEMVAYHQAEANGCCGFFDEEVLVGGRRAMVGCNYGH